MKRLRNALVALALAATPMLAPATSAATSSSGPSRHVSRTQSVAEPHSFTLSAAHRAASRLERGYDLKPFHVGRCRWATPRRAACSVAFGPAVIANGTAPITLTWTDYVVRPEVSPGTLFAYTGPLG